MLKKRFCSIFLLIFALYAVLGGSVALAQKKAAASTKGEIAKVSQDVVVSISSLGEVKEALGILAQKVSPLLAMASTGLGEISKEVPSKGSIGLVGNAGSGGDEVFSDYLILLPVKDKNFNEKSLKALMPGAEKMKVKVQDGVALISPENGKMKAPASPASLLDTLPGRYLFAVQVKPASFIKAMEASAQTGMVPVDGEAISAAGKALEQTDAVLVGINVDTSGDVLVDLVVQPTAGSDEAAKLAKSVAVKSKLVGFYDPEAAFGIQGAGYAPEDTLKMMAMFFPEDPDRPVASLLAEQFLSVQKVDVALSLSPLGGDEDATLSKGFMAFSIKDGPGLKKALQKLADTLADDDEYSFEFDVDTAVKGVNIHHMTLPTLGKCAIAIAQGYAFLSLNQEDNAATLKKMVPATLNAPAPKTQYQAHIHAAKTGNRDAKGSMYVKGYFSEQNTLVTIRLEASLLATQIAPMVQGMAQMFFMGPASGMSPGMMPPGGMPPGKMPPGMMPGMGTPPDGMSMPVDDDDMDDAF